MKVTLTFDFPPATAGGKFRIELIKCDLIGTPRLEYGRSGFCITNSLLSSPISENQLLTSKGYDFLLKILEKIVILYLLYFASTLYNEIFSVAA